MAAPLADALVDLGLRRARRRLRQGADDGAASKADLECVVLVAPRAFQQHVRGLCKGFLAGWLADEQTFRIRSAPGLVSHTPERDPGCTDRTTLDGQTSRNGHQSERIGQPIAQL